MVTDFASFWIDSPWECGGRWMEEKVTKCDQIWGIQKTRLCKVFKNQQLTKSCCASDGSQITGGYRVFLVAIELFVYQVVEFCQRCIQIISGKGDQK